MKRLVSEWMVLTLLLSFGVATAQEDRAQELLGALQEAMVGLQKSADRSASREEIRALLLELKVIYGPDDRLDVFEASAAEQRAARSTVALVSTSNLVTMDNGETFQLPGGKAGEQANWCSDERFFAQPSPAFCSGFMVASDRIATAAHCIKLGAGADCDHISVVFDFHMREPNDQPTLAIPARNVYTCKRVLAIARGGSGESDWSIITVDRAITDRVPLPVRPSDQRIPNGTDLTVIGHPKGLPTKIANNAKLRDNTPSPYFVANLDTYQGNSGSAVLNTASLEQGLPMVEGILVGGETDFERDPFERCYRSKKCEDSGCRGENVTRASEFADAIGN